MRSPGVNYFHIGPRLTLTFALLIALILGGNGLLVWQFHIASLQADRLTGGSQQAIAVLRLQESLVSFHQQLDELIRSRDADRLVTEAEPLRRALLEQIQRTRNILSHLPSETHVDPAFLPTLDAIEIALPSQLEAITNLASSGDWKVVDLRLANEMKLLEAQTSSLVRSIDKNDSEELTSAVANMNNVQRRIVLLVPITAVSTFFIAAFFGWAITRRIIELRLEERIEERTRIARDLHDTMLQSFQGVMMKFGSLTYTLDRPAEAREKLKGFLEQGRQAIDEGREAVQGLRSSTVITNDLARALDTLGAELAAEQDSHNPVAFHVEVEGESRDLHPILRDEVYRIAGEAVRNAFHHACASRIEVKIRYDERQLRVGICDNGKGIDPTVLKGGGRAGHYGLPGMQERAMAAGGKLAISSNPDCGTEMELTIPASLAYAKSRSPRRSMLVRKGA